jgi:uncharacterized protein (TIGR03086 family)
LIPEDEPMETTTTNVATPALLDPTSTDPRSPVLRASAVAIDVIQAIEADQYDLPTPTDMNVGELAEHLVMAVRRVGCAGRDEPLMQWPRDAADVEVGDWSAALAQAADDAVESWSPDDFDRPTTVPWGTFPGDEVLAIYANEIVVHTWDLAQATAQSPIWDANLIQIAFDSIHRQLPDADRGPMWAAFAAKLPEGVPWEDPFANAVVVPDDASAIDKLVAWNGRRP